MRSRCQETYIRIHNLRQKNFKSSDSRPGEPIDQQKQMSGKTYTKCVQIHIHKDT